MIESHDDGASTVMVMYDDELSFYREDHDGTMGPHYHLELYPGGTDCAVTCCMTRSNVMELMSVMKVAMRGNALEDSHAVPRP